MVHINRHAIEPEHDLSLLFDALAERTVKLLEVYRAAVSGRFAGRL